MRGVDLDRLRTQIGRELAERIGGLLCLEPSTRGARFALALRPAPTP